MLLHLPVCFGQINRRVGMKILKEERAQGSIEMLLLVVAAIVVASIVGIILKQTAAGLQEEGGKQAGQAAST